MQNNDNKRVTMVEVAKKAGVTIGTVSHVINNTAPISEETTMRVMQIIKELNYKPNSTARALRTNHSKTIGFMVPDVTNDFYSIISSTFMDCAHNDGYTVLVLSYQYSREIEEIEMANLIDKNVDAILLFNGYRDDDLLDNIKNTNGNPPIILADRSKPGFASIEFDNVNALIKVINMLKSKGYTKIGYISEPLELQNLKARYNGYLMGMKQNGLDVHEDYIYISSKPELNMLKHGYRYMQNLLATKDRTELPEVYINSSDLLAIGIMRAIKEAGYRIPEDIAVVGFDNIEMSQYVDPPLTTVDQDKELMGTLAWKVVKEALSGKISKDPGATLTQNIIIRKSC